MGKGLKVNEYHHKDAKDNERLKMLKEIAKYIGSIQIFAILFKKYNGNHKGNYVKAIIELLKHCNITEDDTIIALDKVEKKKAYMDRYIRKIKQGLKMPRLNIEYFDSERIKGLQIADAVAGAVSMELCRRGEESHFDVIKKLIPNEVKIIEQK